MKRVLDVLGDAPPHWVGDGFPVRTIFSYDAQGPAISPFLLLDHAGPAEFPPSERPRGVGEHPHRGFETVTLVYAGEVEHRDSAGHHGRIGPGDVQWMTAAAGVVHDEFHGRDFTRRGGRLEMVQLWVNLPARHKMDPPRYQTLTVADIPTVPLPGGAGSARVVAGALGDARGPARTFTPIEMWDLSLDAGTTDLALPEGHGGGLLVLDGEVTVSGTRSVPNGRLALLDRAGSRIGLQSTAPARALLIAGEPIDEPIAGAGPFVMNTREQIFEAMRDFQEGRMGRLD